MACGGTRRVLLRDSGARSIHSLARYLDRVEAFLLRSEEGGALARTRR